MRVFDFTGHRALQIPDNDQALNRATAFVSMGVELEALRVVIGMVFVGLEALPEALEYQRSGSGTGKVVVEL